MPTKNIPKFNLVSFKSFIFSSFCAFVNLGYSDGGQGGPWPLMKITAFWKILGTCTVNVIGIIILKALALI